MFVKQARDRSGERGAVALLMAISMVGLCVAAAMVVDLGLIRVDRQIDKSAEDAAAVAGANGLVSNVLAPLPLHPFAGVCQALKYLKANSSDLNTFSSESWDDGTGAHLGGAGYGCNSARANLPCTADPASWARVSGVTDAGKTVVIQSGYTVTGGNIAAVTGGNFSEETLPAFVGDTGDPRYNGCDQVAVFIMETRSTTLGNAGGVSHTGTRVRSVARVRIEPPDSPFALLILDQHACLALANTSNGTINVTGYKTHPGLIHSDSDSTGSQCGAKPVIQGAKADGVVAHEAPLNGIPGKISMVASSNKSDGLANVYSGPAPGANPVTLGQVTRAVLDVIYQAGVRNAVHSASPYVTATSAPAGFANKGCPNNDTWTEAKVFVDCPNVNKNLSLPNATDVIFTGKVAGDQISMPKATRVYVKGAASPAGISVGTTFEMNNVTTGASCPTVWDASKQRAQLFVGTGDLKALGGTFRACNTTIVLMGGDTAEACVQNGTSLYYDNGTVCPQPVPTGPGTGVLSMGGGTTVDWTAPDLVDDEVKATDADHLNLEDLALWSETSGTYTLGGGGAMHLMGVFAAPNADLKLNGGPVNTVTNSQYVARTLWTTGNGTLTLTPLPSLPVAPPTVTFELVR